MSDGSDRFIAWVRGLVREHHYSQRGVRDLTGLSHAQVGKIMRGELRKGVRDSTIVRVARRLEVSPDVFFHGVGEVPLGATSVSTEHEAEVRDVAAEVHVIAAFVALAPHQRARVMTYLRAVEGEA